MLTFRANPAHVRAAASGTVRNRLGEKLGERLGETRAAIVQAMKDNPKVTVSELAKRLRLSTTAIEKNIHYLKTQGYVKRVGPAKGGHWEVEK